MQSLILMCLGLVLVLMGGTSNGSPLAARNVLNNIYKSGLPSTFLSDLVNTRERTVLHKRAGNWPDESGWIEVNVPESSVQVKNLFKADARGNQVEMDSSDSLQGSEYEKRARKSYLFPPYRYKRVRVCPFLNRVGFPLGGCLYSYVKPRYKPQPKPKPTPKAKPARRPIMTWRTYQARWPDFYFLGGALGRR